MNLGQKSVYHLATIAESKLIRHECVGFGEAFAKDPGREGGERKGTFHKYLKQIIPEWEETSAVVAACAVDR